MAARAQSTRLSISDCDVALHLPPVDDAAAAEHATRSTCDVGGRLTAVITIRGSTNEALASVIDRLEPPIFHHVGSGGIGRPRPGAAMTLDPPASQRGPCVRILHSSDWEQETGTGGGAGYTRSFVLGVTRSVLGRLEVTMREMTTTLDAPAALASLSASSRSRRLSVSGSSAVIAGARLDAVEPIMVSAETVEAPGALYLVVSVRCGATGKRGLGVIADVPIVRVGDTRLVRLSEEGRASEILDDRDDVHINTGNALSRAFQFAPRFGEIENVTLRRGERHDFVYTISPRPNRPPEKLPVLESNAHLESVVAVTYRVPDAEAVEAIPINEEEIDTEEHNATKLTYARWRPHALAKGVVVAAAGPAKVEARALCDVRVTVRNQGEEPLANAVLCVRRTSDKPCLTPLRTAVALGRVPTGQCARVALRCAALEHGALALGDVLVVDQAAALAPSVWQAQKPFHVLVPEPRAIVGKEQE